MYLIPVVFWWVKRTSKCLASVSSAVAVAEGVEWSSSNLNVSSLIPSLPNKKLHAEVSLSKMLNPLLCLIEQQSAANRCTV